jgi:hypothetical protein
MRARLTGKLAIKILALKIPEFGFVVLEAAACQRDIDDPSPLGRVAVGEHGGADMFVGDGGLMGADIRGVAQDV